MSCAELLLYLFGSQPGAPCLFNQCLQLHFPLDTIDYPQKPALQTTICISKTSLFDRSANTKQLFASSYFSILYHRVLRAVGDLARLLSRAGKRANPMEENVIRNSVRDLLSLDITSMVNHHSWSVQACMRT